MDMLVKWFQPASADTPNTNAWHAFRLDGPSSLCGDASISYGFDAIANDVPADGKAHAKCVKALEKEAKAAAK